MVLQKIQENRLSLTAVAIISLAYIPVILAFTGTIEKPLGISISLVLMGISAMFGVKSLLGDDTEESADGIDLNQLIQTSVITLRVQNTTDRILEILDKAQNIFKVYLQGSIEVLLVELEDDVCIIPFELLDEANISVVEKPVDHFSWNKVTRIVIIPREQPVEEED